MEWDFLYFVYARYLFSYQWILLLRVWLFLTPFHLIKSSCNSSSPSWTVPVLLASLPLFQSFNFLRDSFLHLPQKSMFVFYFRVQIWLEYFRCLTMSEQREKIISLDLLATLPHWNFSLRSMLLILPQLHVVINCSSSRILRSARKHHFLYCWSPVCSGVVLFPQVYDLAISVTEIPVCPFLQPFEVPLVYQSLLHLLQAFLLPR